MWETTSKLLSLEHTAQRDMGLSNSKVWILLANLHYLINSARKNFKVVK